MAGEVWLGGCNPPPRFRGVGVEGYVGGNGFAVEAFFCQIAGVAKLMIGNLPMVAELIEAEAVETDLDRGERVEREILDAAALRSRATGFMSADEIDEAKRDGRK